MKKRRNIREKGITLVALVVTIIVLMILAGVSISMTLSGEGVLSKTTQAKNTHSGAEKNELNQLATMEEYLSRNQENGGNSIKTITQVGVKRASTNDTTVLSSTEPTTIKDNKNNEFKVPANFGIAYESPDNVSDGIIIEDNNHNQYVWIPVGTITKKDDQSAKIELIRSDFNATTTENAEDAIEGYFYEYTVNPNGKTYANTKVNNLAKFIKSAKDNGGYYIARYEAGISGTTDNYNNATKADYLNTKPLSKEGVGAWNQITQQNAATACKDIYTSVLSDLCNSFAWDTAIDYIQKCGTNSNYAAQIGKSTTGEITVTGRNLLNTNSKVDVQCNIYDMAGNVREWTTETFTDFDGYCPCVSQGGVYNNDTFHAGFRGRDHEWEIGAAFGFRPILYLDII